jgi:tRNA(fMet)-specific endonuclease VapC
VGTVLDTTVFIELERAMRGLPAARAMAEVTQRLERQLGENEEVGIAAITASELLHGMHRATA